MGKTGAGVEGAPRSGGRKACFVFCIKVPIYLVVAMKCNLRSAWNWTYEPVGFQCRHEPLPPNRSGVKVLVYAMSKTGTTAMTRALLRFYRNAYHSEDFYVHIWAPLADEYFSDPRNGGGMFPWHRLATTAAPANMAGSLREPYPVAPDPRAEHSPDVVVRRKMPRFREVLAQRLSMCNVETLAFDGMEHLFWDVYETSRDAKVVMLNWRTWEERELSARKFSLWTPLLLLLIALVNAGQHVLPYSALVLPAWDALTGDTLLHDLGNGTPTVSSHGSKYIALRQSFTERRLVQRYASGGGMHFPNETFYKEFWEEGRRRIPKERLLEFDMRKHTARDLCNFLEIRDDPRCDSGRLPNNATMFAQHEIDRPMEFIALWPYFGFCHWCSYTVLWWILGKPLGVACTVLRTVLPDKKNDKFKST